MYFNDLMGDRRIITVSGAQKGVGKTALSQILLHNLQNFAAIKITLTDDEVMVTDDEHELMVPATDTFRMKESGAVKVVWVQSSEDHLLDAMKDALGKMVPCRGILIEGNSILKYLDPTLSFFVVRDPLAAMKPSRVVALSKADVCVINRIDDTNPGQEIVQSIHSINPGMMVLSLNLLNPAGSFVNDYGRLLTLLSERII